MSPSIKRQVAALERLTAGELKKRYAEVFGEPTRTRNRAWLQKRIAWRIQCLAEGDLSERARRRAEVRNVIHMSIPVVVTFSSRSRSPLIRAASPAPSERNCSAIRCRSEIIRA